MWTNTPRPLREDTPKPIRCGRAINLTIDHDAEELLRDLCPSRKALGRFLSELVRREAALREERQKVKAALLAALDPAAALEESVL
jgi:hypothetical protein